MHSDLASQTNKQRLLPKNLNEKAGKVTHICVFRHYDSIIVTNFSLEEKAKNARELFPP